jgi:nitrite reductase/ring-hydroxylating ferredoxin subunit
VESFVLQSQWHEVCPLDAFPAEGKLAAVIGGWHVILVREGAVLSAFNDRCPHQGAALSPGKLRRGAIMCPLHGARFKVDTGECIGGAYPPLRVFAVRVEEGAVLIALPADPPGPGDLPVPGTA